MNAVVVVDDEPAVLALTTRWLEASGYAVRAAASADEGLALIEADPPGVLVCDVAMPVHDGFWLVDQVRRRFPDIAIVMATGGHDLEAAAATLRRGVSDYLMKPFTRARLLDAVTAAMPDADAPAADADDSPRTPNGPQGPWSVKEGA
jgi:DNA-binding NtrC family response regulator